MKPKVRDKFLLFFVKKNRKKKVVTNSCAEKNAYIARINEKFKKTCCLRNYSCQKYFNLELKKVYKK